MTVHEFIGIKKAESDQRSGSAFGEMSLKNNETDIKGLSLNGF